MNCADIKNKLAARDQEVADKKAKSLEYFNLIKDDVLEKLINDHIEDDFKSAYYAVFEPIVAHRLYEKLGCDGKLLDWNHFKYVYSDPWERNCCCLDYRLIAHMLKDGYTENIKNTIDLYQIITDSFDFKYFGDLIIKYIKSKGFKQKVVEYHNGEKRYESSFKINRYQLENQCCENKGDIIFYSQSEQQPISDIEVFSPFNIMITIFIIIAFAMVLYNV